MKHDETEYDSAALHGRPSFLERRLAKVMPCSCSTSTFQCQGFQRQGPTSPSTCRICLLWMEQVLGRATRQDVDNDLPGTSFWLSFPAIHPFIHSILLHHSHQWEIAYEPVTTLLPLSSCVANGSCFACLLVLPVCLYFRCFRVLECTA